MLSSNEIVLDLENYEKIQKLFFNSKVRYDEIVNTLNGKKYLSKSSRITIDNLSRKKILDLYREIYINSKINHPSFLKFIGFNLKNFKSDPKPVIIFEHISKQPLALILNLKDSYHMRSTLENLIEIPLKEDEDDKTDQNEIELNDTQKLILIYGIASGMSYLHSHDILHRNLNSSCIFFDDNFFPKISGFDISKELTQSSPLDEPRKDDKLKGEKFYLAPEILSNLEYGKPSDVYSFGLLLYEIVTNKVPKIDEGFFYSKFECEIPVCMKNLIEKCLLKNPQERPSFDEIVSELKSNQNFITKEVNENEFKDYINFIESSQISFCKDKVIPKMDNLLKSETNPIKTSKINPKFRGPLNSSPNIDISQYKPVGDKFNISVVEKETKINFHSDFSSRTINNFLRYEIVNFCRSVNIMTQLNHPSIIKFVGYSPVNFEFESKPVCITEDYYEIDIKRNCTRKLMILYGIASGMAYLHSHNIIHRNLKPENIVGTKYGLPKITGFNIAKEIQNDLIKPNKTIKGPPLYIAPEVYLKKGYSKKSDVYSFALIAYEIITKEDNFLDFATPKEIKTKFVDKNQRPQFKKPILKCYRELIEKCWSKDPNERPTFDEIVTELKTNPDFITDSIDKEKFLDYVQYIDNFPVTFDPNRRVKQLDDILQNKLNSYLDIRPSIHFRNMSDTEYNNLKVDDDFYFKLDDFSPGDSIKEGNFYEVSTTVNEKTKITYVKKHPFIEPEYFLRHDIINFSRELNILLQLNHPSILEFIGYALDFHEEPNLIVEFSSIGSLDKILEFQRKEKSQNQIKSKHSFSKSKETNKTNKKKDESINEDIENDDENEEESINDKIEKDEEESVIDKIENDDKNEEESINGEIEKDEEESVIDKIENEEEEEEDTEKENSQGKSVNDDEIEKDDIKGEEEEEEEEYFDSEEDEEESNEKDNVNIVDLDDTTKLIIIYGIAAGMSYLHSNNILHRDLKPGNIYLDDSLFPKISGFNIAKEMTTKSIEPNEKIKGTAAYIAPEVYLHKGYSQKSDVYSFSLVLYELITGEKPFANLISPNEIKNTIINEKKRPNFTKQIMNCYRKLIEKCWSEDPEKRPTFDEILFELKNNSEFITDEIDAEKYQEYIKMIENSPISFETSRKINNLEDFVSNRIQHFDETIDKISFRTIYETETNNVMIDYDYARIDEFERLKLIQNDDDQNRSKMYIIRDKKTKTLYIAKKELRYNEKLDPFRIINLATEIRIMLEIKHPSFLKFIHHSPVDFKNKSNPIYIFEYSTNGSLEKILEVNRRKKGESVLNNTKKLILIYGIAAAMSYLHSINIIHCRLKPSNIYLDDFLFPKITGFTDSRDMASNPIIPLNDLREADTYYEDYGIYNAPELMKSYIYSSASDVYSFAIIAYQLITDEIPFQDDNCLDGYRPPFTETTPECYKKLITKCWDQDPKERPTFDEIITHIKNNPEFISTNVDKEEFLNYVQFIDEVHNKCINNEILEFDNYIQTQNQRFRKIKIDYNKLRDWLRINLNVSIGSSDLSKYSKQKKIGNGSFGNVYKVIEKQSDKVYAAKVSIYEMDQCDEDTILNFSREIDIISSINHPSVLKFIGFCPNNFKNKPKPVIITEFAINGSLEDILKNERRGFANYDWDDTKKLINIYGIAAGMAFLENRDIIHRDLKPANILLDEYLYPKIADFGMSKSTNEESALDVGQSKHKRIVSGFKGTYAYAAPEVITKHEYSTKGDVYSYAMIIYEIITNEQPLAEFNNYFQLMIAIKNHYRPKFNAQIPYCYKNLIQKCWSEDPYSRPYFSKICNTLLNDPNFITKNVDKEEFMNYVDYIDEFLQNNNDKVDETNQIDEQQDENKFNKVSKVNLKRVEETEEDEVNDCFIDPDKFETGEIIFKKDTYKICKISEKETENKYAAFISMMKVNQISKEEIDNLSHDLSIISTFNHPSLLKFIGFSLYNFKKQRKPIIITEIPSNGALEQILELEKMNKSIVGWDNTKKLINIYGIASGMKYMHSHGIIHRCLKPSNIYLNDVLLPKIGDFGLFTRFTNEDNMTHQSMSGTKGTPIYSAPEVLESNSYSKSSDVYSFSLIVYEILTNEKPFDETENASNIYNKIVIKGERPSMKETVSQSFQKLIESCWSQNPDERPDFDEIVHHLKMDKEFITDDISKECYQKYIDFIDSKIMNETNQKIKENISEEEKDSKSSQKIKENISEEEKDSKSSQRIKENISEEEEEEYEDTENSQILEISKQKIKYDSQILNDTKPTIEENISEEEKEYEDTKNSQIHEDSESKLSNKEIGCKSINKKTLNETDHKIEYNDIEEEEEEFEDPEPKLLNKEIEIDSNLTDLMNNERNISNEKVIKMPDIEKHLPLINEFISTKNSQELMNFLNTNCDYETTSFIFDKCYHESPDFYINLCREGISLQNAVAHHKYALSFIFKSIESKSIKSQKERYNEAIFHLKESIRLGFNFSYFSLSRLYYEIYQDYEKAFKTAQEGFKNKEQYSTYLFGYFISHGIGTPKDFDKGISLILSCKDEEFRKNFATEIGLYYSKSNENQKDIFKWFEKAFEINKTKATINNVGVCYMKGIGVNRNDEKAKEIFQIGANKNDSNSMYNLGHLFEGKDQKESFKYYKMSADQCDPRSQLIIAKLLEEKEPNLSIQYYIKAAENRNIEAQQYLAMKYASKNDIECTLKYIFMLIDEGSFEVPLKYALILYRSKNFKQALYIFGLLSNHNHPIAKYFIGVMKYKGEGCEKNIIEAIEILKKLSDQGIDRASEFLEEI